MISRTQRILFYSLLGLSILMTGYLVYLHSRARSPEGLANDDTPIDAPSSSSAENIIFAIAHDADGTMSNVDRAIALPQDSTVRSRALLEKLLAEYALPQSEHHLPGGIAVDDVFLLNLPLPAPASAANTKLTPLSTDNDPLTHAAGTLAVVNLRSGWVEAHPSGVASETLTVLSIVGTLHANLPSITRVRFLVDGQPRATLAGHVSLMRTYSSSDAIAAAQQQ